MTRKEFDHIMLPQQHAMYGVALNLTGNRHEAADLVQNTFMRLWDKRRSMTVPTNPRAYCLAAMRNVFIDTLRAANAIDSVESLPDTPDRNELRRSDARSDLELVIRIINSLPPNQRLVIRLSSLSGYSNEEIARITGLTDVNVRTLLSRGRKTIRNLFIKNS